jgi:peroxiredoxin Q/BCP
MKNLPLNITVAFLLVIALAPVRADAVDRGSTAPAFDLLDQNSNRHTLSDYSGQWLVLYFYPKNDTPGCTTQACEFRDDIFILKQMGVAVVGVSLDDVGSHKEFAEKYSLPFPLLSDAEGEVARRYGALTSFGPVKFAKRQTFIIAPDGEIAKVYRNVRPKEHSDEVIADLRTFTTPG